MTFGFIKAEKARHSVDRMCWLLGVSRSGFYAWLGRGSSRRAERDAELLDEIREVYAEGRMSYGSPRVYRGLKARGHRVSRKRVARLMKANGIRARIPKKYRVTTNSKHHFTVADNVLDRRFSEVKRPYEAWAGDVTYIRTRRGWLYLAIIIDVCSRRVVGFATSTTIGGDLAVAALKRAFVRTRRTPRLFHSDRGSEWACKAFQDVLVAKGITPSMSRSGDCWDNAVAESFFATLKRELVYLNKFSSTEQAELSVFEYIEVFYNRVRTHSALGYLSPVEFEVRMAA